MHKRYIPHGIVAFVVVSIALYLSWFFWIGPSIHNVVLEKFSEPLFTVQLPDNTQKLDSLKVVGQQIGNGDHCDYLAAVLLKTSLSKIDFETYYKQKYGGETKVEFIWLNEDNLYTSSGFSPLAIHTLKDWVTSKKGDSPESVIVYIFESSLTSTIDYRCS